jgi:dihydrofolate synthase / folylpolyglutamate synthase
MFSRVGASAYKKDQTNTIALCEFFDNPHYKFKSIHIGGTNGKGSTTNYLASILTEAGLKVGIYTSPHLIDFRERIKIGNEFVSEQFVIDFVEKAKPIIEKVEPSFFELTVVMAFEFFTQQNIDIAMIEVGLGGRLDSTNVISPLLSIITNISLDHTNMLGYTLERIAYEKAGIIKKNTPVIIGEFNEKTMPIFQEKAKEVNAEIYCAELLMNNMQIILSNVLPSYQFKNLKTVNQAFKLIVDKKLVDFDYTKTEEYFTKGINRIMENTGFAGRWTRLKVQEKQIILECAHNEAGIRELTTNLENETYKNLYIIFGTVNDKDISTIIKLLPRAENINYILTKADIPRALQVDDLTAVFKQNNHSNFCQFETVKQALNNAIERSQADDLVLVTGSIFLVGEVMGMLKDF